MTLLPFESALPLFETSSFIVTAPSCHIHHGELKKNHIFDVVHLLHVTRSLSGFICSALQNTTFRFPCSSLLYLKWHWANIYELFHWKQKLFPCKHCKLYIPTYVWKNPRVYSLELSPHYSNFIFAFILLSIQKTSKEANKNQQHLYQEIMLDLEFIQPFCNEMSHCCRGWCTTQSSFTSPCTWQWSPCFHSPSDSTKPGAFAQHISLPWLNKESEMGCPRWDISLGGRKLANP